MKTIGIILRPFNENNIEYLGTRGDLFSILEHFPVNTIGIPITNKIEHIIKIIEQCDGIILSGGNTITTTDNQLVKYLYDNNIPTLGICLGMQSMTLTFNNNLEMKVKNHYSNEKYVHSIRINEKSTLFKILNKKQIVVNSRHHYAIPKTNFSINALSYDGLTEGIEDNTKTFFMGLQWHPETLSDENSYKIFQYFINTL